MTKSRRYSDKFEATVVFEKIRGHLATQVIAAAHLRMDLMEMQAIYQGQNTSTIHTHYRIDP